MEEETKRCSNKAEVAVPWAGKIMKGCKKHATGLVMLGNAMGSPVEARELPPNNDGCEFADDL